MEINLAGKVAVITGVGRGIGREIATTFAAEGAVPVLLDVHSGDLADCAEQIRATGVQVVDHVVDVRDHDGVREAVDDAAEQLGRIDILVNNAGVGGDGMIEDMTSAQWDLCFDVNVKGIFHTCQAVVPHMKRQRWGRILNASSFAAIVPMVGSAAYAASKSAVAQYSRALAGELGPWGITVNAYAPGMVPTELNGFASRPEDEQAVLLDLLSLRRWGRSEEVAQLLAFLASDLASYITGTLIDVSGGKLATQVPALAHAAAAVADETSR